MINVRHDMGAPKVNGFTWGWSREFDGGYLHQRIFGTLVQLAAPVVKEFHGDLFHDASWIKDHVDGPGTFYFVVRHSGTHVGSSAFYIGIAARQSRESTMYRCSLTVVDGKWTFDVRRFVVAERVVAEGMACSDCANVIANGTGNGPILDDGREHYAAHAEDNMRPGDWVLSGGCPDEDGSGVCLVKHDPMTRECPLSCRDALEICLVCGTRDYGHHCPVVQFGVWDADAYRWVRPASGGTTDATTDSREAMFTSYVMDKDA